VDITLSCDNLDIGPVSADQHNIVASVSEAHNPEVTNAGPTNESMALGSLDTHHTALPSDIGPNLADQHSRVALNSEFQAADANAALTATNVLYDKNRALGSVEPHNNDKQTGMITLP
jgi:hypothetical protein